jgi:hypothetical protein
MSIDAIGSNASASVSAIGALTHDLDDERRRREATQPEADSPPATAQQAATVVTISDEVMVELRRTDALAVHDTNNAVRTLAASIADRHDTVNRAAAAESSAVHDAIEALREASRQGSDLNGEAIMAEQDRAADSEAAEREGVATGASEQEALQVGTTNDGIQVSFGALASTLTGDAPLQQPGLSVFA